jgi:hypothetical protein
MDGKDRTVGGGAASSDGAARTMENGQVAPCPFVQGENACPSLRRAYRAPDSLSITQRRY